MQEGQANASIYLPSKVRVHDSMKIPISKSFICLPQDGNCTSGVYPCDPQQTARLGASLGLAGVVGQKGCLRQPPVS